MIFAGGEIQDGICRFVALKSLLNCVVPSGGFWAPLVLNADRAAPSVDFDPGDGIEILAVPVSNTRFFDAISRSDFHE